MFNFLAFKTLLEEQRKASEHQKFCASQWRRRMAPQKVIRESYRRLGLDVPLKLGWQKGRPSNITALANNTDTNSVCVTILNIRYLKSPATVGHQLHVATLGIP